MRSRLPSIVPNLAKRDGIALPAEDALRGAQAALRRAGEVLEPVEQRLPRPLRKVAHELSGAFSRRAGSLVFELGKLVRPAQETTSGELHALLQRDDAASTFARVVTDALTQAFARLGADHYLASSTLAASAWRDTTGPDASLDSPARRAARLCASLREHRVAARAPGTAVGMTDADHDTVRLALFAVGLWMLVRRETPRDNEDEILTLCVDVAASVDAQVFATGGDEEALARLLESYHEVI